MKKPLWVDFVLPFFIVVLLTIFLSLLEADLEIEKWFYTPDGRLVFTSEVAMDCSV